MNTFETPGLLVPPLTAFDENGDVDIEALCEQIDYVIDTCDPSALIVMGVETQEYRYLSVDERAEHVRAVAGHIDDNVPIVAGVSALDPADAVQLGRVAESVGAVAVQALIPARIQGGETRLDDVIGYFSRLGAELDVPTVAYHNPRTGASLSTEEMITLTNQDSVVAVKESSRNMRHVLRLIDAVDRDGRAQYFTTMELLIPSLVLGGSGVTMPPPAAELGRKIIDAYEAGNVETAIKLQHEFGEFPARWLDWGLASALKAAFEHLGLEVGTHPATSGLTDAERDELGSHLDTLSIDGPNWS